MAFIQDFSVAANGDIRHVSGTTRYTVLEVHRALQDLADNASGSGDDSLSILDGNPSSRQTDQAITLNPPFNIDDATAQFIRGGSITQDGGDTLYSGINLQFLVQPFNAEVYVLQDGARSTLSFFNPIQDNESFLVKARTGGTLIDNGDLRFYTRQLGNSYSDLAVNVANGGLTTVFLGPGSDSNVDSADSADYITGLASLAIAFGTFNYDANNGNGSLPYSVQVTVNDDLTPLETYQALQYLTRDGSSVAVGTGNTEQGQFYRLANPSFTPLPATPFGIFAGGNLTGAQGVHFVGFNASFSQNFIGTDNTGVVQTPPNLVGIAVNGVVAGDRVLVANNPGGGIVVDEFSLAAGNTSGSATLTVSAAIDAVYAHPSAGVVRVFNASTSQYDRYEYDSIAGAVFNLSSTLSQSYAAGGDAFVPFIDEVATGTSVSVAVIQSTPVPLSIRVRNGGGSPIVPFETTATLGAAGASVTAIRQSDA